MNRCEDWRVAGAIGAFAGRIACARTIDPTRSKDLLCLHLAAAPRGLGGVNASAAGFAQPNGRANTGLEKYSAPC